MSQGAKGADEGSSPWCCLPHRSAAAVAACQPSGGKEPLGGLELPCPTSCLGSSYFPLQHHVSLVYGMSALQDMMASSVAEEALKECALLWWLVGASWSRQGSQRHQKMTHAPSAWEKWPTQAAWPHASITCALAVSSDGPWWELCAHSAVCPSIISSRYYHQMARKKRTELGLPPATRGMWPGRGPGPDPLSSPRSCPGMSWTTASQPGGGGLGGATKHWVVAALQASVPRVSWHKTPQAQENLWSTLGAEHMSSLECWHCAHCTSRPPFREPNKYTVALHRVSFSLP